MLEITASEQLPAVLDEALRLGRAVARDGRVATYIPELARADPALVAVAVSTVDGSQFVAGDADASFTLQSISKVFALACLLRKDDESVFERVSMEPSGDAFHSIVRLEAENGRPRNPLINAGAILVSSRLPGRSPNEKIQSFRKFLNSTVAGDGGNFPVDEAVFMSELATGFRNRALANFMKHHGVLDDPVKAVDTYFQQCSMLTDVRTLARAGLFLANDGIDPQVLRKVVSHKSNRTILALMTTCGLYDEVGRFAVRVGIPAKSGVSGGMLGIVPGRMSIACYGAALGPKGNSVAGMRMLEFISDSLGLSVFSPR